MPRPELEVADVLRDLGAAWRSANAGHVSLEQLKVMSATERCRTAALGGHVARCEDCSHTLIAYNSCRNRHCPKCQGTAAKEWLAEREAELLPVPYFHVLYTLWARGCSCWLSRRDSLREADKLGEGYEISPSPISTSSSKCCRASGRIARRKSAILSNAGGTSVASADGGSEGSVSRSCSELVRIRQDSTMAGRSNAVA